MIAGRKGISSNNIKKRSNRSKMASKSDSKDADSDTTLLFSLGLVADIQFADMADSHVEGRTQRFRECPGKLKDALAAIKGEGEDAGAKLAALLTLGDVINGNREDASLNPSDLETVASVLDALALGTVYVTGDLVLEFAATLATPPLLPNGGETIRFRPEKARSQSITCLETTVWIFPRRR